MALHDTNGMHDPSVDTTVKDKNLLMEPCTMFSA
jgi:hypothetical protein